MSDGFDNFDQLAPEMRELTFVHLEQRAAEPARRAILDAYLTEIDFPSDARVLEVGCGTGPIIRVLAHWPGVREAVGIEPWQSFVAKARELGAGIANLSFEQADGHALPFEDATFDVVAFHTTLLHMRDPATALAEAHRVLRAGGWISIFDPDPQATSYALNAHDPLQTVYEAMVPMLYRHPWLPRRLPDLVRAAGFHGGRVRNYGTVETKDEAGVLNFFDRLVDRAAGAGIIGADLAGALKEEARERIATGRFVRFGGSVSVIARKEA